MAPCSVRSRPGRAGPGDLADPTTPVAHDARAVADLARVSTVDELDAPGVGLPGLPAAGRLARGGRGDPRAAFADRDVLGAPGARLRAGRRRGSRWSGWPRPRTAPTAPAGSSPVTAAATGSTRRCYRAGLANQPTSVHAGDGLALLGARVVAAVRCAPPANKPTPVERDTCRPWLATELSCWRRRCGRWSCSAAFGWQALWPALKQAGLADVPRPAAGLRARCRGDRVGGLTVLGCYHVSQQNTFTGTAHRAHARRRLRPRPGARPRSGRRRAEETAQDVAGIQPVADPSRHRIVTDRCQTPVATLNRCGQRGTRLG